MLKKLVLFIAVTTLCLVVLWRLDAHFSEQNRQANVDASEVDTGVLTITPLPELDEESNDGRVYSTPKTHDQLVALPSLEGTDIDGAIRTNNKGELIVDQGVRDFFDYFLSTADELGPDVAISEVGRYIRKYLPQEAQLEAVALFENYLRFKNVEFEIQQAPLTQQVLSDADALGLLRKALNGTKAARARFFSKEEEQALFGLEDTSAEYTLKSLELLADENKSDAEKRQQLDALVRSLPPELQESIQETELDRNNQQSLEQLLASDRDDSQLHEELVHSGVSQEKANEIIANRQAQREFSSIYSSYLAAKAELDQQHPGYVQHLNELRARFFVTPEQKTRARLQDLNN